MNYICIRICTNCTIYLYIIFVVCFFFQNSHHLEVRRWRLKSCRAKCHGLRTHIRQTGKSAFGTLWPRKRRSFFASFFVKSGWCKWGDGCKFEHIPGPDTPTAPTMGLEPSGEICQFFSKSGWCKYGDHCKHQHIGGSSEAVERELCNFFSKSGWCQYGAGCKYAHISGPDAASPPGHSPSEPAEVCQFFAKSGWCKFGEQCRYKHISDTPAPVPERSGEVCQFFSKSGWCKYGDQCKHEHIGEAAPNSTKRWRSARGVPILCQVGLVPIWEWLQISPHAIARLRGQRYLQRKKWRSTSRNLPVSCAEWLAASWSCRHLCARKHGPMRPKSGIELSATQAEIGGCSTAGDAWNEEGWSSWTGSERRGSESTANTPLHSCLWATGKLWQRSTRHCGIRPTMFVYTIAKGYVPRGFWRIWVQKMQAKRKS